VMHAMLLKLSERENVMVRIFQKIYRSMHWTKIVLKCVFSFNKKLNKTLVLNIADLFDYSVIK